MSSQINSLSPIPAPKLSHGSASISSQLALVGKGWTPRERPHLLSSMSSTNSTPFPLSPPTAKGRSLSTLSPPLDVLHTPTAPTSHSRRMRWGSFPGAHVWLHWLGS
uniref:Run domain Beclin-1 interacting and cystein-rich containing protein n=1 Tax=Anthurium amnicola TaxID=1678845 RepID=A0A1D1YDV4_9ARAE